MGRKKINYSSLIITREVYDRLKTVLGYTYDSNLLELFGISRQSLSYQIKNNTINAEQIYKALVDNGKDDVNLHWLLTGEGPKYVENENKSLTQDEVQEYSLRIQKENLKLVESARDILDAYIRNVETSSSK